MEGEQGAPGATHTAGGDVDRAAIVAAGLNKVVDTLAPHAPQIVDRAFQLGENTLNTIKDAVAEAGAGHRRATVAATTMLCITSCLLAGLAALALYMGKVDTAEKIVIALVSFLGGTAFFGGSGKR